MSTNITTAPELTWTCNPVPSGYRETHTANHVDHGTTDERGRRVGGLAVVYERDSGRFLLIVTPTRDGRPYGSSPGRFFATLAEAKAAAPVALAAQRARYAKKYPAAPAVDAGLVAIQIETED
jgi:hypothetical protein